MIYARKACIVYHGFDDFIFSFVALFAYFWVLGPFTRKNVFSIQNISLPIQASEKLKCTCPKALVSKFHLSGQVGKYLRRCLK